MTTKYQWNIGWLNIQLKMTILKAFFLQFLSMYPVNVFTFQVVRYYRYRKPRSRFRCALTTLILTENFLRQMRDDFNLAHGICFRWLSIWMTLEAIKVLVRSLVF
jgi:hypothetical protein